MMLRRKVLWTSGIPEPYKATFDGNGWFMFDEFAPVAGDNWSVIFEIDPTPTGAEQYIMSSSVESLPYLGVIDDHDRAIWRMNDAVTRAVSSDGLYGGDFKKLEYRNQGNTGSIYLDDVYKGGFGNSTTSATFFNTFGKDNSFPSNPFQGVLKSIQFVLNSSIVKNIIVRDGYFYDTVSGTSIQPSGSGTTFEPLEESSYKATFNGDGWFEFPLLQSGASDLFIVEADIEPTRNDTANIGLIGSRLDANNTLAATFYTTSNVKFEITADTAVTVDTTATGAFDQRYVLSMVKDPGGVYTFTYGSSFKDRSYGNVAFKFDAFGNARNGSSSGGFSGDFYGLKLYISGALVLDVIPKNGYFFDKVTNAQITPSGTGTTFTKL